MTVLGALWIASLYCVKTRNDGAWGTVFDLRLGIYDYTINQLVGFKT
jgi:hypothetical protein